MMKLNVGLSQKVGLPDYGSRGASVHMELEVEAGLVRQPDELQRKIDYLFGLAKASVGRELSGDAEPTTSSNGNGHQPGRTNGHSATASQVRAIHAIANRRRLDLTAELRSRFGVERPDDLSISEASEMIDAIKPETSGTGGR